MTDAPAILLFSRDPGGTNQMLAVHALLAEAAARAAPPANAALAGFLASAGIAPGVPATVYAAGHAVRRWRSAGIAARDLEAELGVADHPARAQAVGRLLESLRPGAVITATSDLDSHDDLLLWRAAQGLGIPCAAMLDHRVNLADRFRAPDGSAVWPDLVLCVDAASRATLVQAGAPTERLAVAGDLHLARVADAGLPPGARERLRRLWGVDGDRQVVLFASECVSEMAALGRPAPYDEHEMLARLLALVAAGERLAGVDLAGALVLVRPHPRDRAGKYERYAGADVRVSADGDALDAVAAADLVVGMDSTLLDEAAVLGRPTHSLLAEGRSLARSGS